MALEMDGTRTKIWQGVLLLCLATSMAKSQTLQDVINTVGSSGNSTNLHKAESVSDLALNNDGDLSTAPFYSTTMPSAVINSEKLSSKVDENTATTASSSHRTIKASKSDSITPEKLQKSPRKSNHTIDYTKKTKYDLESYESTSSIPHSLHNDTLVNYRGKIHPNTDDVIILNSSGQAKQPPKRQDEPVVENQTTNGSIVLAELTGKNDEFSVEKESTTVQLKADNSTEKPSNGTGGPKGRTISFGEGNDFSSHEKTDSYVKKNPYEVPTPENIREPTEKVITESSVVNDNSIQSIKPVQIKRSGGISPNMTTGVNQVAENIETVADVKSTVDLTENGLTEAPERNSTTVEVTPTERGSLSSVDDVSNGSKEIITLLNVTETTEPSTMKTFSSPLSHPTSSSTLGVTEPMPTISSSATANLSGGATIDSTTASPNVEYEFVSLTETTLSSVDQTFATTEEDFVGSTVSSNDSSTLPMLDEITDDVHDNLSMTTVIDEFKTTATTDFSTTGTTDTDISLETTTQAGETTIESSPIDTEIIITSVNGSSTPQSIDFTTTSSSTLSESSSANVTDGTSIETLGTTTAAPDVPRITPEDVTVLVRIVIEGTWADVCPYFLALKQSLADLVTRGLEKVFGENQILFQQNPCTRVRRSATQDVSVVTLFFYVVDAAGHFDGATTKALPSLYTASPIDFKLPIRSISIVQDNDSGNTIAVIIVSCVAFICLILLASLLFIMRKRQTRFNYGERCRPVSLDAYSLDSVSAYNSVRRKGAIRASKRSYGNPTFEDSSVIPSHPLNFASLSTFCEEIPKINEEFGNIPQVSARIDELPTGAEVKNRYANVVPLPETRVPLQKINNDPLSEYINASYVRGPRNATKYYIACQAPLDSTITDFWRMIWEQQSKVIIMLTDLIENGVEKCAEYIPPSEVTDCHRLFGDFQVTLKKRETKEKYAISTLLLKNLENNTYREISHIWYLWPVNGVQSDAAGLIAVLLEARALQRGGPGPIVVHCSPGTGRTGTLIALDLGIRQYEITRTVDVPRVVYIIRRDRAGAVQTKEQYAFIYKALNLYATKLAGGGLDST